VVLVHSRWWRWWWWGFWFATTMFKERTEVACFTISLLPVSMEMIVMRKAVCPHLHMYMFYPYVISTLYIYLKN
jgi:hypothetical protein